MALYLITGIPGSGKTYYAVNMILTEYFVFSDGTYRMKAEYGDLQIITNIEDLKLPHISLKDAIAKSGLSFQKFFTEAYQEKISQKYPKIIYLIDECQQYFHPKFYDPDTFFYFDRHRHLGHDIFLITLDRARITKQIYLLVESEIRAVKRSLSFMGELKYNIMQGYEVVGRKVLKPTKKIFDLYKSQSNFETKKVKNPLMKWIFLLIIGFPVAVYLFYSTLFGGKKAQAHNSTSAPKSHVSPLRSPAGRNHNIHLADNKWVKVDGVIHLDGQIQFVVDPRSGDLVPVALLDRPIRFLRRDCWISLTPDDCAEMFERQKRLTPDFGVASTNNFDRLPM